MQNKLQTDGMSKHELYTDWKKMCDSVYNIHCKYYPTVGGAGIQIYEPWHSLRNFIQDVKERPYGLIFTRTDVSKDYGPNNYTWSTKQAFSRNNKSRKLSANDIKRLVRLRKGGMSASSVATRLDVATATVNRIYKKEVIANKLPKRKFLDKDSLADMLKLKSRYTLMEIAIIYDISYTYVQRLMQEPCQED